MPKEKLSHQKVKAIKKPEKPYVIYDQVQKGLELRISKAGTKSFCFRYEAAGKYRRLTLGRFPDLSLSDARARVRELKVKVKNGEDPQATREEQKNKKKPITFKELADKFITRHLPTLSDRTSTEYKRIIETELLDKHGWGHVAAWDITSQYVREVLNHKAYEEDAFTMANRIRSTISKMFEFGIKHIGLEINENPVGNTPVFKQGENKRDRVYNDSEIKELWQFWETRPEPIQSIFKILLLTGQRKTETMQMRWDHIESDKPCKKVIIKEDGKPKPKAFLANVWVIDENKSKRRHEVPLPDFTYNIICNLWSEDENNNFVFASNILENKPIQSIKSTSELIKKETSVLDFRPHDLRRTMATKLEQLMVDQYTIKKLLNHAADSVTSKHYTWYDYMDKKLEALQRWNWRVKDIIGIDS